MEHMLDTNICIYLLNKRPLQVQQRLSLIPVDLVTISVVTFAELMYGVEKSMAQARNLRNVEGLLSQLRVIQWDHRAARDYGKIRADLERKGTPIGNMDLLIAAHARSRGVVLVTHNRRGFIRIPDLIIDDWI